MFEKPRMSFVTIALLSYIIYKFTEVFIMNHFDWNQPYIRIHSDTRTKKEKIISDLTMLLDIGNIRPFNTYFQIWIQLIKHLFLKGA